MNLSIIIPNYNGAAIMQKNLPKVLEAVKTYKHGSIEIIIPNDPSTDNSSDIITSFIHSITDKHITAKTIENKNRKDSGFSSNVNRGTAIATGDILILLNTDVSPHEKFIDSLPSYFEDEKVFGVAFMDESIEDGATHLRGRGIGKWYRGLFMHSAGNLDKQHTLWISGGSGAFRKVLWDKFHGLDTLFNPFYWEDIDLSYRALKSGYKILFEKKIIVVHEHEKGIIKNKFSAKRIKQIAYRNQFIFIWKNITQKKLLLSHVCWLPYHLITAIKSKDWPMLWGFYYALRKLSKIRKSREIAQKYFIRRDSDILNENKE